MEDQKTQKEYITQNKVARGKVKAPMTRLENTSEDLKLKNEISIRLQRLDAHLGEFIKLDSELSDLKPNVKQRINQTAESICQRDEMLRNESTTLQMPITTSTSLSNSKCISFIPTAKVLLYNKEGDSFLFRVLLDSVFDSSFEFDYLKGVPLSDEDFSRPSECDITLGSDCFFTILRNGKIIGSEGQQIARITMSDWVVADSQVVLSWLSSPPHNWKPFIANRTSEILDCIPQNLWRYVPTKENSTDIGSRVR
ncbi:DUF1758 domain-containing protein [Nephila pilipes]|uniref:DUF1758 domain-containing protein n=1 Tax=Nephila pilipes TaxID=299642 RepID=A0A8X6MK62_NEPPI|nr:DUF1758 domain-containing protein [Nephila pilipes]